ncbi:hypothetical protein RISK_006027 [Rhodopirellula islandica]|uniref:Uncharacterized protein n=1 Tax=Rhodopirellula islandica TaxID=595434 RepID=A0A0J1B5F6_RHOIS|nr:hypothetical protein RISK_006027 [Rhodopirellula islandica]
MDPDHDRQLISSRESQGKFADEQFKTRTMDSSMPRFTFDLANMNSTSRCSVKLPFPD